MVNLLTLASSITHRLLNKALQAFLYTPVFTTLGLIIFLLLVGTGGYILIEGWTLANAVYMTLITVTTVGFGEVEPLSSQGRVFTVFLILGGIGIVTYTSSSMVQFLLSGELQAEFKARRREHMLAQLQNHYIVCGFGRVGRYVADELYRQNKAFVIIDVKEAIINQCLQLGYTAIIGDGADDDILEQAGIYRARSLITAVQSDAQNVFITLTARSLCPDLVIVARANTDGAEPKLRRAGANRVIIPYAISGRRMVSSADHPAVVDFLDVVMHSPELELWLEDLVVMPDSSLVGHSLREAHLRSEIGVNVLSMQLPGQAASIQLDTDIPLQAGTRLIVLGNRRQLTKLEQLVGSVEPKIKIDV